MMRGLNAHQHNYGSRMRRLYLPIVIIPSRTNQTFLFNGLKPDFSKFNDRLTGFFAVQAKTERRVNGQIDKSVAIRGRCYNFTVTHTRHTHTLQHTCPRTQHDGRKTSVSFLTGLVKGKRGPLRGTRF